MPTVEDVARKAVAAVGVDTSYLLVCDWVSERYGELANRVREMRHLRRRGSVFMPAPVETGLISVANGSNIVVGDATAQAAWSQALRGRYLRISITWYRISEVIATSLMLDTPYSEETVSLTSYRIVARELTLAPGARHFSSFIHARRRGPLTMVPLQWLQECYPNRQNVGPGPLWVAESIPTINENNQLVKTVEFYPYSSQAETIDYLYWIEPERLNPSDQLPMGVDEHVLKDGVLIDVMRYEMGKALRAGQLEVAATWRNDYRAQRTVWEDRIKEALRIDRGPDDAMSMLELPGGDDRQGYIPSAHTMVYDNWPR